MQKKLSMDYFMIQCFTRSAEYPLYLKQAVVKTNKMRVTPS